jgi:germination protein M
MSGMKYVAIALGIVLAGLLGVIAASCGTGSGAQSAGPVPAVTEQEPGQTGLVETGAGYSGDTNQTDTGTTASSTTASGESSVGYQVWFHRGEQLYVVSRLEPATPRVGSLALYSLLEGPHPEEDTGGVDTQIPAGTKLLGLGIDKGIATVDLTSEFESGGGTASMTMRLAQVVCTLDQFPTVKGVLFKLDGQAVDVLGGEGIVIDHPLKCSDYKELLPAILVARPSIGATISSPVTVSGTANVFEANVTVEILDHAGNIVGSKFTTATCGTGCRGTFSVTVPYEVSGEQAGTIVVHDDDAAGTGHPPHEVRIPVVLEPSS